MVRVGILHPIESYWLIFGANDKTSEVRKYREEAFQKLCRLLLFSGIYFDYISEALLPEMYSSGFVGKCKYDIIIVPDLITIRTTTLDILCDMKSRGIEIVFAGGIPTLADGLESAAPEKFARLCKCIQFTDESLLSVLEAYKSIEIFDRSGKRSFDYISAERIIDGEKWLLIAKGKPCLDKDSTARSELKIVVEGIYTPELFDALRGKYSPADVTYSGSRTFINISAYSYDSFLFRLTEGRAQEKYIEPGKKYKKAYKLSPVGSVRYRTEEKNVCLLDIAEYSFDDIEYFGEEEMLRIDTACRKSYGLPSIIGKNLCSRGVSPRIRRGKSLAEIQL